jgi:hypothetical protein
MVSRKEGAEITGTVTTMKRARRGKGEPGKDGNCWCGFLHKYADCYVMNPLKRPDGFIRLNSTLLAP